MMKSALAISGGMPMSPQTAAIAPSMLTGMRVAAGAFADDQLHGANHLDVLSLDLQFERHLEQPRRARIAGVEAVAEAGNRFAASRGSSATMAAAASRVRRSFAHELQPGVEKLHAALDVPAVVTTESEHAGRHARAQRRPVVAVLRAASVDGGVTP